MENQKNTSISNISYDETKIYTPRSFQMHREISAANIYDHAPVRIYKKPIKRNTDISKNFNLS